MEKIVDKINILRTQPTQFQPTVSTVAKALKRIRKTEQAEKLEAFIRELDTLQPINSVKFSKSLSKLCEDELKKLVKTNKESHVKSFHDLKKDASKFIKNFNKLFMTYDKGDLDFIICRLIVSEHDPQQLNKSNFLSADYNYIGVAHIELEHDEEASVIMFADYVEEIDDDFNFEDFHDLKEAFDSFDINQTESLDIKELKQALRQLNYDLDNPGIYEIIDSLDIPENEDGVDFKTFCLAFDKSLSDTSSKAGLKRLFKLFINDPHSDSLSETSVRKLCNTLNIPLKEGEARDIIERASLNGHDISFDEFYNIMTSHINDASN